LTAALLEVARTDKTSDATFQAIFTAEMINRMSGGVVVAPWDVWQLPQDWLDAFKALAVDLPNYKKGIQRVNELAAAWREKAMRH
jgi:hypothetical protein